MWCEERKVLLSLDLTVSYEIDMDYARFHKRAKYQDLVKAGQAAGFNVELLTVEVGSRGLVDSTQLSELGAELGASNREISQLCTNIIRKITLESYKIWYCGIVILSPVPIVYVLVKVPARVLYGNYWARGKFEKVI